MNPSSKSSVASLLSLVAAVSLAEAEVVDTRMLEERVAVDDVAGLEVVVDNVFGRIRVTGHDRSTVEMHAVETVRADTQSDIERAHSEVGLRTVQEPGRVAFLVRRTDDDCSCDCSCRWNGYIVEYDIELRVPHQAAIDVSTVNDGEIVAEGVHGSFRASNVNGPVTLRGLREAGHAETVNGDVFASFERSPVDATSFETVNGDIEVVFPRDLSGDLYFKSMRGEFWTDFAVMSLPVSPVPEASGGRTFVIRADRYATVRVASGGPAHTFETLNGDIYVRESD
jgi:hypothetical protein